jgi:hypothetical protein
MGVQVHIANILPFAVKLHRRVRLFESNRYESGIRQSCVVLRQTL